MFTKKFFYGEGTDHIVRLTQAEADAANKIRLIQVASDVYKTNLSAKEMKAYNRAADKLNAYLEDHSVHASEEFLANNDMLRPVK